MALAACGAPDPADSGETDGLGVADVADPDEVAVEVDRVRAALGEATCASTPADVVWDPDAVTSVYSTDGSYDHSTCRNAFVVDVAGLTAGQQITGGAPLVRWNDPLTCLLAFGGIALYQKQAAGYVKVAESVTLGKWGPLPMVGYVCSTRVGVTVPSDGDYKIVTSAGTFFVGYSRVQVY